MTQKRKDVSLLDSQKGDFRAIGAWSQQKTAGPAEKTVLDRMDGLHKNNSQCFGTRMTSKPQQYASSASHKASTERELRIGHNVESIHNSRLANLLTEMKRILMLPGTIVRPGTSSIGCPSQLKNNHGTRRPATNHEKKRGNRHNDGTKTVIRDTNYLAVVVELCLPRGS
jgi:hypothetical protein